IPRAVTHTLGEALLLPIIPFGVMGCFPLALGARLRIPFLTMAIGTFLLFRREAYERIGGHEAVRSEIAEDVVLARRVRKHGGNVLLLDGSEHLDVHFYRGFWETWHGLAKSAFAALEYRLLPTLLMLLFYGFLFLWPVLLLVWGIFQGRMGEPALRLALFQVFMNSGLWYAVAVRFRLPRATAFLYPLTVMLVILVMLDSIRMRFFSGIGWKERVYQFRGGSLFHGRAALGGGGPSGRRPQPLPHHRARRARVRTHSAPPRAPKPAAAPSPARIGPSPMPTGAP
ncbi:MAG: glycosyltransferase, partial [Anaerolineae bacterium]|nr:glycosyltransferase [Anaerolineae bacterium]